MFKFKFYAINGIEETEIQADSIKLVTEDGQSFELCPRRSDGDISLYANRKLAIEPRAANLIYIKDKGFGN